MLERVSVQSRDCRCVKLHCGSRNCKMCLIGKEANPDHGVVYNQWSDAAVPGVTQ